MELTYIVALCIGLFGIVLGVFLSKRRKYRTPSAAQNYHKIREKLTLREEEPEEEIDTFIHFNPSGINIPRLIGRMVALVLILYIASEIMTVMGEEMMAANVTSPTFVGLRLIGYEVSDGGAIESASSSGIIAIIALVGILSIIMEFFTGWLKEPNYEANI